MSSSMEQSAAGEVAAGTLKGLDLVLATQSSQRREWGPFVRWHLRKKFAVMQALFDQYVVPGSRVMDAGCSDGDALVLARSSGGGRAELWGLDIDRRSLQIASARVPTAVLIEGDLLRPPENVPREYFDVVHEFGAAFLVSDWSILARTYFSLLRSGGVLLWELPQRWSAAHLSYLLSVAPKVTEADTRLKRILRTFLPSKYTFASDRAVSEALQTAGCEVLEIEKIGLSYFYCRGLLCTILDSISRLAGDATFESLESLTGRLWPRYSGYYVVLRKK